MTNTASRKGDSYRKRYPLAQITNAAYKRLLARVDRQIIKVDGLKARIEDLEEMLEVKLSEFHRLRRIS